MELKRIQPEDFFVKSIIDEETVFAELRKAIVKALGIEEEIVRRESILTSELGAESLDFLDINYNLEQTFGFKMARYFVLDHAEELFGEGSMLDKKGQLTEQAVKLLQKRFGSYRSHLKPGMGMDEVTSLVTVQSIVNAVMDILDTLPEHCVHCGRSSWESKEGTHVVCGSCGESATYTNGDELTRQWLMNLQEREKFF